MSGMTLSGLVHTLRNAQLDRFIEITVQIGIFFAFFPQNGISVPDRGCVVQLDIDELEVGIW
jgi:hypothetical protein